MYATILPGAVLRYGKMVTRPVNGTFTFKTLTKKVNI